MKSIIYYFCIFVIIIYANFTNASDLFESSFNKIEFESNNIEDTKNHKILELKLIVLSRILKNILTNEDYIKIRNKINNHLVDSLIKNMIIENEKILNNRYSADIKINFNKELIITKLRNNKLSYVEYLPDNFFTIILDQKNIQKDLFTKDNNYYNFLLTEGVKYLNFYNIPNLDINDRFLIQSKNIIDKDLVSLNKILDKYNKNNLILIYSKFDANRYNIEISMKNKNSFIMVENLLINDLNFESFFLDLKIKILNLWKTHNSIQNDKKNTIYCLVSSLNIYELNKINSLIKTISSIKTYKLKKIKLFENSYEINYYGDYDILKKLFNMKLMNINLDNNICKIKLK